MSEYATAPAETYGLVVPSHWRWSTFAEVSERVTVGHVGSMLNEYRESGVPFLRGQNVRANRYDSKGLKFVSPEFHESLRKSALEANDIVVTRSGEVGVACVIPGSLGEANCSDLVIIKQPHGIDPKFAAYYLNSAAKRFIAAGKVGVAITHFNTKSVAALPVPLPPLSEQRRIVARIEELFSRLDAGVAALRHAKAQLQRYRQSVLAAAVTGSLPGLQPIPPESWRPISDVIKTLDQGWSPKCESNSAESEDEWAVIKTTAIQAGFFLDYENKKLPSRLEPRGHLELKIGDLLLTRAGPRSRVGVACYVRKVRPRLMLCDKAYRVRLEPKKATPGFIELVLNSPRFVDALDDMKSGISDSGLNLTQKRFAELLIPLPTLAEQQQIVAEVEARTTAIDHLEGELDRQITRSNRLRQSALASAFAGTL